MPEVQQPSLTARILTAGVAVVAAVAVLAIGGVHPATQVALSAAALALLCGFLVWRRARGVRAVPFASAALLALAVTALQLLPLPAPLVRLFSPAAYQLQRETGRTIFMTLTLDAPATWLALARGAACTALLVIAAGLVRSSRHARRLLWIPAGIGGALAAVALMQRAVGAHAILGFYTPRSTPGFGFFGTFVDVNHASSVLALGCLTAAGLAIDSRGSRRLLAVAAACLSLAALAMTFSRGGLVAFALGAYLLTIAVIARANGVARATVVATVLLVAGSTALLWANEGLRARMGGGSAALVNNQKTRGWAEGLHMTADYPVTGVGRGAFEAPINAYRHADEGVRLVYPESIAVQMLSEWGVPATLGIVALAALALARVLRCRRELTPALVGGACGVLAVVVHELFDFGLEFPGVAFVTAVTLGIIAGAVARQERQQGRAPKRFRASIVMPAVAVWIVVLAGAAAATQHTLDADYDRLHVADEHNAVEPAAVEAAIARHPADDFLELIAARAAARNNPAAAMRHLNRAMMLHPASWQAHRMAARLLVAGGRPAQAALEYRLAIANGLGPDVHELTRVLGDAVVRAVPQTTHDLDELAEQLYAIGDARRGDLAAQNAVDVADNREPALVRRVQLARSGDKVTLAVAAKALLAEASEVESFTAAGEALAAAGDRAGADAALAAARRQHRNDARLLLAGARMYLDLGDAAAARDLLTRNRDLSLTLEQRQHVEELLAQAADRTGDHDLAVVARARARLIAKQLHDMSFAQTSGSHP